VSESVEVLLPSPTIRSRRRGWIVAVVIVVVLGLGGGGFAAYRWLTGGHLFVGPGASESLSLQAGHTIYVGLEPLPADPNPNATIRVDLRRVHPLVRTNTSDATVTAVEVAGAQVTYRVGIRGGNQDIGAVDLTVNTP